MSAEPRHLPRPRVEQVLLDPYATLVPEAKYRVGFVSEERIEQFGRSIWVVVVQILDEGDYSGLPLFLFLNKLDGKRNPPNSAVVRAFVAVTGKRPPRGLGRQRPSWFLAECQLEVEAVTVTKDRYGNPRPGVLHFSRVKHVVARTSGTPPCLRNRDS